MKAKSATLGRQGRKKVKMKIIMNKDTIKANLGRVIFLGVDYRHPYEKDKGYDKEKIEGVTLHVGCERLADSVDVVVETLEPLDLPKFANLEFEELSYDPYATVSTFNMDGAVRSRGVLTERFHCIRVGAEGTLGRKPEDIQTAGGDAPAAGGDAAKGKK